MRTRTVISAVILIALCTGRFCFPKEANKIRDSIIPAISRDADLREDFIAIGQAISGKRDCLGALKKTQGKRIRQAQLLLPNRRKISRLC